MPKKTPMKNVTTLTRYLIPFTSVSIPIAETQFNCGSYN